MFMHYNPNPDHNRVEDCTIRALCKALNKTWDEVYAGITAYGYIMKNMPSANVVWGAYLKKMGYRRFIVDDLGKEIYTVKDFCYDNPTGKYILAVSGHVLCVDDGDYFDSWDSGDEVPVYYWKKVRDGSSGPVE